MKDTIVIVSGGFDPIHIGHVRMIQCAKSMGDYVIAIANNDVWLKAKKGYIFMPMHERAEIVLAIIGEEGHVISTTHKKGFTDRSVCAELRDIRELYPNTNLIFANGGDRNPDEDAVPEVQTCKELDIAMVYNVGGEKIQSSSDLVKRQRENESGNNT